MCCNLRMLGLSLIGLKATTAEFECPKSRERLGHSEKEGATAGG